MKNPVAVILVILISLSGCQSAKRIPEAAAETLTAGEPIILLHGLSGWGRDEIPGFNYWGGFTDLEAGLRREGFNVHTAAVGPFSSNWDRACELYAQLAGGTVDYGQAHSKEFGHERFGRTYPGLIGEWDRDRRIHIIAHSMGGQTARLLVHLLNNGDERETSASGDNVGNLFRGGNDWVASVTTLSTPHNGTFLTEQVDLYNTFVRAVVAGIASLLESGLFPDIDVKLDQWGIVRGPGENLPEFFERVMKDPVWTEKQKDLAIGDLSVDGAIDFNSRVPADPHVYYFSWVNEASSEGPVGGYQIPEVTMLPLFLSSSFFIGSYDDDGLPSEAEVWWMNDGVVNTVSMPGPVWGTEDIILRYQGFPMVGVWNFMGRLDSIDHADILGIPGGGRGIPAGYESILDFYIGICRQVTALPKFP